jgi:hypothetical protein
MRYGVARTPSWELGQHDETLDRTANQGGQEECP